MDIEILNIKGMHSGHCARLVRNSLSIVKGLSRSDITFGTVKVSYDENVATLEDIKKAFTRIGYQISN